MAVTATVIIPPISLTTVQTTQYTSSSITTILDKFTATNYSTVAQSFSVNVVSSSGSVSDTNLILKTKSLSPSETYTCPELVGHVLKPGDFISTIASAAASINIRASGRQVS